MNWKGVCMKPSIRRQCQLRVKKWIGLLRWYWYYWKQDEVGREKLKEDTRPYQGSCHGMPFKKGTYRTHETGKK